MTTSVVILYLFCSHVLLPLTWLVASALLTQREFKWAPTRLDVSKWEQAAIGYSTVQDSGYDPVFDSEWSAWCAAEMNAQ